MVTSDCYPHKEIAVKHFVPPNGNTHTTYEAVLPKVKSDPDQASGSNHLFTRNAGNKHVKWYHERFNQQNPDWKTIGQITLFLQQLNCKEKRAGFKETSEICLWIQFMDLFGSWFEQTTKNETIGETEKLGIRWF